MEKYAYLSVQQPDICEYAYTLAHVYIHVLIFSCLSYQMKLCTQTVSHLCLSLYIYLFICIQRYLSIYLHIYFLPISVLLYDWVSRKRDDSENERSSGQRKTLLRLPFLCYSLQILVATKHLLYIHSSCQSTNPQCMSYSVQYVCQCCTDKQGKYLICWRLD